MYSKKKLTALSCVVLICLTVSLIVPISALADDSTPPPPPDAPEVSQPVDADAPATEAAPADAAPTDALTNAASADSAPTAAVTDNTSNPEALSTADNLLQEEAVPDTQVVVLNAEGQAEPLATQEAAAILTNGDPIWCPSGHAPDAADSSCVGSSTSLKTTIDALKLSDPGVSGTIWIAQNYNPAADTSAIVVNGSDFTHLKQYGLTLQGGWNGINGSVVIDPSHPSTFNVPLAITGWEANVFVSDLVIDTTHYVWDESNGDKAGLTIDTTGDISVDNTTVVGGSDYSAKLRTNHGNINVQNSTFSNNNGTYDYYHYLYSTYTCGSWVRLRCTLWIEHKHYSVITGAGQGTGLGIDANGTVNLTDVVANNNKKNGTHINDSQIDGDVNVTGGSFSNNGVTGLLVSNAGDMSLNDVIADGNKDAGAQLNNRQGSGGVSVTGGSFSNNSGLGSSSEECTQRLLGLCVKKVKVDRVDRGLGLDIQSNGNITLLDVEAEGNKSVGANLENEGGSGDISVMGGSFSLTTGGTIVTTSYNCLTLLLCNPYNVDVQPDNSGAGLFAGSAGDITVTGVTANSNAESGAVLDNCMWEYDGGPCTSSGNIFVDSGTFNHNGEPGLVTLSAGNIRLANVVAIGNDVDGAYAYTAGGTITVDCGRYENNGNYGIEADPAGGTMNLHSVGFSGNGDGDYRMVSGMAVSDLNPCGNNNGGTNPGNIGGQIGPGVIPITGGQPVTISCETPSTTLQTGDIKITFTGLCGYQVIMDAVAKDGLPGSLGEGNTFEDGVSITLFKDGKKIDILPAGADIRVSYPKPASGEAAFMFWNGSVWTDMSFSSEGGLVVTDLTVPTTVVLVTH